MGCAERCRSAKITYRLPPDEHQEAVQTNKVLWLAAVFAFAALAGCSPPPRSVPTVSNRPAGQLTGTMNDWVKAVCERGAAQPVPPGPERRHLTGAGTPMKCSAATQAANAAGSGPEPIVIGTYASRYVMELDLSGLGAYAKGTNGTQYVVFATLPTAPDALVAESTMLQPLEAYGFEIFLSASSSVESPSPTAAPGRTHAMPPPTSTRTSAPESSATTDAAQPHWDGAWLRNYRQDGQDCNGADLNYWVVQPSDATGMYALKKGCFPDEWVGQLKSHCQSLGLPAGKCAVWDQDSIMSAKKKRGDLLVVKLTEACLDRAGLDDFHEGPLHKDCMVKPNASATPLSTSRGPR
jgi:hypothetical protein